MSRMRITLIYPQPGLSIEVPFEGRFSDVVILPGCRHGLRCRALADLEPATLDRRIVQTINDTVSFRLCRLAALALESRQLVLQRAVEPRLLLDRLAQLGDAGLRYALPSSRRISEGSKNSKALVVRASSVTTS